MKKWLKITLWLVGIFFILTAILGVIFYKRFVVLPPKHAYSSPQNIQEAQLQDINYLSLYPAYDYSFDSEDKVNRFNRQLNLLKERIPVSKSEFEMDIAKALAIADNAHSNISSSGRAKRLNAIPLRFYWFKEGLYIVLAQEGFYDLLGKKVLSINGFSPEVLLTKMKPWFGGNEAYLKNQSPLVFMSPEALTAMGIGPDPNALILEYTNEAGILNRQNISALNDHKDIPGYWPNYWLNPAYNLKNSNWKSCTSKDKLSLPFQHIAKNVHHDYIGDVAYVQINENGNDPDRNLKKYLKEVAVEMKKKQTKACILDLRFNQGGHNYHLSWPFIKFLNNYLGDTQKCWIVTGNSTFSAGIITAAFAKHTLKDKAIIVGEPIGDRMQFWADGGASMTLPNSKIRLRIWTAYNDWENGCNDLKKCFWFALFDSFPAGRLTPNQLIPLSFEDYLNHSDSVIEYILSSQEDLSSE